jgi:hypothetical protein
MNGCAPAAETAEVDFVGKFDGGGARVLPYRSVRTDCHGRLTAKCCLFRIPFVVLSKRSNFAVGSSKA